MLMFAKQGYLGAILLVCSSNLLLFQMKLTLAAATEDYNSNEKLVDDFLKNFNSKLRTTNPTIEAEVLAQESKNSEAETSYENFAETKANAEFKKKDPTCNCTKFFLCDIDNGTSIEGADVDVIDIRVARKPKLDCDHYLDICCNKVKKDGPRPVEETKSVCGIRNPSGVGFRIIGDADGEAQFGEFPWMAAITRDGDQKHTNVYLCGGSLIHPRMVLTAAHCIERYDASKLRVRLGEWDTQTEGELFPSQDRQVAQIFIHEGFNSSKYLKNDIALLLLEKEVQLAPNIATICLVPENTMQFEGKRCFVSGWGKDSYEQDGAYQVIMKRVEVPVVLRDTCQLALRRARLGDRFHLHDSFVCAGGELGRDSCKGDGGSPLVCKLPDSPTYVQYGIVSWGLGCGQQSIPGVYVNVPKFFPWIEEKMARAGLNSGSFKSK